MQLMELIEICRKGENLRWFRKHGCGKRVIQDFNERKIMRRWFTALDNDHSGKISIDELLLPLTALGCNLDKKSLRNVIYLGFQKLDIDFNEFVILLRSERLGASESLSNFMKEYESGSLGDLSMPFMSVLLTYQIQQSMTRIFGTVNSN